MRAAEGGKRASAVEIDMFPAKKAHSSSTTLSEEEVIKLYGGDGNIASYFIDDAANEWRLAGGGRGDIRFCDAKGEKGKPVDRFDSEPWSLEELKQNTKGVFAILRSQPQAEALVTELKTIVGEGNVEWEAAHNYDFVYAQCPSIAFEGDGKIVLKPDGPPAVLWHIKANAGVLEVLHGFMSNKTVGGKPPDLDAFTVHAAYMLANPEKVDKDAVYMAAGSWAGKIAEELQHFLQPSVLDEQEWTKARDKYMEGPFSDTEKLHDPVNKWAPITADEETIKKYKAIFLKSEPAEAQF